MSYKGLNDDSFDSTLSKIEQLTWLPWVGQNFKSNTHRVLIVGESHYMLGKDDKAYNEKYQKSSNNKNFTRDCIYECAINEEWRNPTYENINRVLVRSNKFSKKDLWRNVAFYNFISHIVDYRVKERPEYGDFYKSWKTFKNILEILKPTVCIFIGVEASNSFNSAIEELGIKNERVNWENKISTTYPRTASVKLNDSIIPISFIQHTSHHFSWSKWNDFLLGRHKTVLNFLNHCIEEEVIIDEKEIKQTDDKLATSVSVPTHLSHKPIIACDYQEYRNTQDDAKFLSFGRAQYNKECASVKIFRRNKKWSRQSEEVPIERVTDMTLMLVSTINRIYNEEDDGSILNETVITPEDLSFLKSQIENNKEDIKKSLTELKSIINRIDLNKI